MKVSFEDAYAAIELYSKKTAVVTDRAKEFNNLGKNYTRNEWRRSKTTLETSGEDLKLHPKRVEKM